jgi:glyoxylase-like metal-dependent hydrolase (beta-lactamase superfamily II)
MVITEVRPGLHQLLFDFGQSYLWRDGDAVTLIDAGSAGNGADIGKALGELGLRTGDVDHLVLTHYHPDHAGGAAEVSTWDHASVLAHALDAPVIRGTRPMPPPDFTDAPQWERDFYATLPDLPPTPPSRVDRELVDGDVLDFGGGAQVLHIPGHTDGSIAVYLPGPGVVFTGDTVANVDDRTILGVFNRDRAQAFDSFRRLSELDVETVCFGHGNPVVGGGTARLRAAVAAHRAG